MEKKYDAYLQIGTKGLGAKALGRRNAGMISLLSCTISYWKKYVYGLSPSERRNKRQAINISLPISSLMPNAHLSASSHSQKHKKNLSQKSSVATPRRIEKAPPPSSRPKSKLSETHPQEHTIKVSPTLPITHKPPHQPSPCAPRPSPSSPPPTARVSPVHSSPTPSKPP
jgi:hypothetical protein